MKNISLICFFLFLGIWAQAQKFGYINSSQLLLSMPELKAADADLKSYQDQLIKKGEGMVKEFETKYNTYLQKVNLGEFSQIEMQQQEGDLAREQQTIQNYEVEVQQLLAQRKQDLYQPILDKVQEVVNQVGKENNYTMIFDSGIGGILFAVDGDDLMPEIKKRLGMN